MIKMIERLYSEKNKVTALAIIMLLSLCIYPALGQDQKIENIKKFYQDHCVKCHGTDGSAVGEDGKKLKGAPYAEAVWFCTTNDTGPAPHSHEDFDEFIGFIGSDPEDPENLNGEVNFFIEDEMISSTKSCLVYIPRGLRHSPIYIYRSLNAP